MTLFTTASGLGVQQGTATDAAGQAFEVSDHRFLYRFTTDKLPTYDASTKSFGPEGPTYCDFADPDLLGEAARASASFPVAFRAQREPDGLKCLPLRMRPQSASARTAWLMDGGVLDNAPFGPVLDTIAKGSVAGDVSRFIVYVVPSVGIGTDRTNVDSGDDAAPGWFPTLTSALSYPREVDFRSDVEELQRLHEEADASWSDAQTLFERAVIDDHVNASVLEAAHLLQPTYAKGRAAGAVWETMVVGNSGHVTSLDKTTAAPLKAADDIMKSNPPWTPPVGHPIDTLIDDARTGRREWPWGLAPAERVVRTVLRATRSELKAETTTMNNPMRVASLEKQLKKLSDSLRHILALRELVEKDLHQAFGELDGPSVLEVAWLIKKCFEELAVSEALGTEIATLEELSGLKERLRTALAVEVVSRCTSSRTPDQRSAPFSFVRLGPDATLPVLDDDGQSLAKNLGNNILYGSQAGKFGAFGADDWRRWDWLMGRLHAASHLGMLLQDPSSSDQPQSATDWIKTIQTAICTAEGFTVEQVREKLQHLQNNFANTNVRTGLARMLDAMNVADQNRPDHERATRHLGDRVVAVSSGVKKELGTWIHSLAGRSPADESSHWHRLARWYLAPTRAHIWQRLTGQPQAPEPAIGVLRLVHPLLWRLILLGGLALIAGSVTLTIAGTILGGLLVAYLAGAAVLVGALGLMLVILLRRWGEDLNRKLISEFAKVLPDTTSAQARGGDGDFLQRGQARTDGRLAVSSALRERAEPVGIR